MNIFRFAILSFALMFAAGHARAAERHVQISLIPESGKIEAGGNLLIGVGQQIVPNWHTYWVNPGDSGEPMRVTWHLPDGFSMGDMIWPAPGTITTGPLTSYGYEGGAIVLQTLKAPADLPKGPIEIKADIETLVCKDICIPEYDHKTLTLNDGRAVDNGARLHNTGKPRPFNIAGAHYAEDGKGNLVVSFPYKGELTNARKFGTRFAPYEWGIIDNSAPQVASAGHGRFSVTVKRGVRPLSEIKEFRLVLTYADALGWPENYDVTATPASAATTEPSIFNARTVTALPAALLLALLGGLILNLMPCVFPVLSMKALSLLKMTEKEKAHARLYGLAYTAGIIVCFGLIAGTLLALKAGGAQIGWGFQLQNPLLVLLLSWLLFIIGLNFSGLFEISGSFTNVGANLAGREGVRGSFFTGMLAAIVATPCTAPFMAGALGYALVQPALIALLVFLALGIGLALPYLLICFLPPLQKILPRPGHWMQTLREFLAFPMYGSAAWLVWVYGMQVGIDGVPYALAGIILLAMIFWLATHLPHSKGAGRALAILLLLALLAGLGAVAWTARPATPAQKTETSASAHEAGTPETFTPATLEADLKTNDPVFVDMTAAWCITCKINEKVALSRQEVKDAFRRHHVHYIVGDWTNQDKDITAFLTRYGRQGVPIYVYYPAPGADGKRPESVLLPQILTPSAVIDVIENKNRP